MNAIIFFAVAAVAAVGSLVVVAGSFALVLWAAAMAFSRSLKMADAWLLSAAPPLLAMTLFDSTTKDRDAFQPNLRAGTP